MNLITNCYFGGSLFFSFFNLKLLQLSWIQIKPLFWWFISKSKSWKSEPFYSVLRINSTQLEETEMLGTICNFLKYSNFKQNGNSTKHFLKVFIWFNLFQTHLLSRHHQQQDQHMLEKREMSALRVVEWVALIRFLFGMCHY